MIWLVALLLIAQPSTSIPVPMNVVEEEDRVAQLVFMLPDRQLTPGSINATLTAADLCAPEFSAENYRHVSLSRKKAVCARYRVAHCPGPAWEIDHLISLELGGSNGLDNLWPQPIAEAREKDRIENRLRHLVCEEKIPLSEAQHCLATNWTECP